MTRNAAFCRVFDSGLAFSQANHAGRIRRAKVPLFTVRDVARFFSISEKTIYRLIEDHAISHRRLGIGRGAIRFTASDLDDFLQRRMTVPHDIAIQDIEL